MVCTSRFVLSLCVLGAFSLAPSGTAQAAPPFADELAPGGQLRGIAYHVGDPWALGYWEHIPGTYDPNDASQQYPLAIYLHGLGPAEPETWCIDVQTGEVDGTIDVCPFEGCGSTTNGLCGMRSQPVGQIANGAWDDDERPFITVFPQIRSPNIGEQWDPVELQTFLDYLLANYPVDPRRVYIFALSQGGRGALEFVAGNDRQITAVSISPGGGVDADATCRFQDTALWAFHGENDQEAALGQGVFSPCTIVRYLDRHQHPLIAADQFPACAEHATMPYPPGRMTMFVGRAHNVWDPVIFNSTQGFTLEVWADDEMCNSTAEFTTAPDPAVYPDGIYSWFLSLDRPDTSAGEDFEVPAESSSFELVATTLDDDPVTHTWTQIDGPAVTIDDTQDPAIVTDFEAEQSYTFEVLAVDADQQWDRDQVTVTIAAPTPGMPGDTDGTSDTDGPTTGSTMSGSDTNDPGPTSSSDTTATSGTTPPDSTTPTTGADADTDTDTTGPATNDDTSGCACTTGNPTTGSPTWLLLLLPLLRRARPRSSGRASTRG